MWEVVWTDPDKKSRRQHRERKKDQQNRRHRSKTIQDSPSSRTPDQSVDRSQGSPGSSTQGSVVSQWTDSSVVKPVSPCSTSMAESITTRALGPLQSDAPINLFPKQPSHSHRSRLDCVPSWDSVFKPNNHEAWKPLDTSSHSGRLPAVRASASERMTPESKEAENDMGKPPGLNELQREIKRITTANNNVHLLRLKELWRESKAETACQELEMEKTIWMLSALDNMDRPVNPSPGPSRDPCSQDTSGQTRKILALFESHASYLAAVHSDRTVCHISSDPLPHTLFSNIHPVFVPSASMPTLPVAPGLFDAAYSLTLPSMVPAAEVPRLLSKVHGALAEGGRFHLTLIDPMPSAAATLGPLLRAWLEKHLLIKLERNFRTTLPSKLFPCWLADASLRAEGSTITTTKFLAVPLAKSEGVAAAYRREEAAGKLIKQELRSFVGRMLWVEVWGRLVTADDMWWEDELIVRECYAMRTAWDYSIIEAVKHTSPC
ncbi:hypothetical protein SODALDRAFT_115490 [Sodiomyces alkalinus F11]|uniref:Methyltransferase type 11 domain-containing protein n=1 Tax=Sodiomyces alkalinus (strain CBS 110278 / VKM F-3762 / F11) TaxID=1314773 RepID=A0A3N2Q3L2_SODAK|nr:hypothetical protein SODALDRAFT_115490 [Sodiomyces alkalinus F11]ROT41258.1 hypothetical protein SODALDRAFT_115490 [Sodiomyces alkalinus F11]